MYLFIALMGLGLSHAGHTSNRAPAPGAPVCNAGETKGLLQMIELIGDNEAVSVCNHAFTRGEAPIGAICACAEYSLPMRMYFSGFPVDCRPTEMWSLTFREMAVTGIYEPDCTGEDECTDGHDERSGATSEDRCVALAGCCYRSENDHCEHCSGDEPFDPKPEVVKGIDGDCLSWEGVEEGEGSFETCMPFCEEDSDCIGIQTDSKFKKNCELVSSSSEAVTSCGRGKFTFYPKGYKGPKKPACTMDDTTWKGKETKMKAKSPTECYEKCADATDLRKGKECKAWTYREGSKKACRLFTGNKKYKKKTGALSGKSNCHPVNGKVSRKM